MNRLWRLLILTIGIACLTSGCAFTKEGKISRQLELGQKYLLEEDYEQAVIAFNKVIELDASRIEAYEGLIGAYAAAGDYSAAIATYDDGLQYTDDLTEDEQSIYAGYLLSIAEAVRDYAVDAENAAQVIDWCNELLSRNEDLIAAYEGLINAYLHQGDVEDAYDSYIEASKTGEASTDELAEYKDRLEQALCDELDMADDPDEQMRILQMLITLCPERREYKDQLSELREAQRHRQTAERYIARYRNALNDLLEQCRAGDDIAVLGFIAGDTFGAMYLDYPDTESKVTIEDGDHSLVLCKIMDADAFNRLCIYYGEIDNGVFSGQGTLYADGTSYYRGQWVDDMPNGIGTATTRFSGSPDVETVTGNYTEGLENGDMTRVRSIDGQGTFTFNYTAVNGIAPTYTVTGIFSYPVDDIIAQDDNGSVIEYLEFDQELGVQPYATSNGMTYHGVPK